MTSGKAARVGQTTYWMNRKDISPTEEACGIYVTGVLPLPACSHGVCDFCGCDIGAEDGELVRVVVVSGAIELYHSSCFIRYAGGLGHVRSLILGGPRNALN